MLVHLLGVRFGLVELLHSVERVKEDLEAHLVEFVGLVGEQFAVLVEEWMAVDFLESHPFGSTYSSRRPLSLILVQPWQAEEWLAMNRDQLVQKGSVSPKRGLARTGWFEFYLARICLIPKFQQILL